MNHLWTFMTYKKTINNNLRQQLMNHLRAFMTQKNKQQNNSAACFNAWASWSGHEMLLYPHLIPSSRLITSSAL